MTNDVLARYPEHAKLAEVRDVSQEIGFFLDGGLPGMGLVLAERDRGGRRLRPTSRSIQAILADYFDIDESKLEDEKGQILAELQAGQR